MPTYTGQLLVEFLYIYIICKVSSGWVGPAVFKLNHHPQPPSKCIGLYGFCQEVYLHKSKINLLHVPGIWDIVGLYQPLTKGPIMRTDRKEDLDKYYNDHLKMKIIRRLQMVDTWSEIMGIDSAIWEALDREDKAEQDQEKEFKDWQKNKEEK